MLITPEFPENRIHDPKRQAEWRVYQELAASGAPGRALYEVRASDFAPQLDFGVWMLDYGHQGLQVKGGPNHFHGGIWTLDGPNGPERIECPVTQTFDAAIAIRDVVKDRLRRDIFIHPILVFPDMEPDPLIEARAREAHVHVAWAGTDLVALMKDISLRRRRSIRRTPPTAETIAEEIELIQPWQAGNPGPEAPAPAEALVKADATAEIAGGKVVVHVQVHLPEGMIARG